ncbi:MAG: hypothetical protein LBS81_03360 [Endomicrobium sp.]|jgi:hypothetical protein|nr:hypothetical protein [Endomicrobium sp.]
MATERLLKWSKNAQKFFEESADKSLDLKFMFSQANENQTGDGFEEFVNSINKLNINRKIKK